MGLYSTSFSMSCMTQGCTGMGQVSTFVRIRVVEYYASQNATPGLEIDSKDSVRMLVVKCTYD